MTIRNIYIKFELDTLKNKRINNEKDKNREKLTLNTINDNTVDEKYSSYI
jgi:hypothetical protein